MRTARRPLHGRGPVVGRHPAPVLCPGNRAATAGFRRRRLPRLAQPAGPTLRRGSGEPVARSHRVRRVSLPRPFLAGDPERPAALDRPRSPRGRSGRSGGRVESADDAGTDALRRRAALRPRARTDGTRAARRPLPGRRPGYAAVERPRRALRRVGRNPALLGTGGGRDRDSGPADRAAGPRSAGSAASRAGSPAARGGPVRGRSPTPARRDRRRSPSRLGDRRPGRSRGDVDVPSTGPPGRHGPGPARSAVRRVREEVAAKSVQDRRSLLSSLVPRRRAESGNAGQRDVPHAPRPARRPLAGAGGLGLGRALPLRVSRGNGSRQRWRDPGRGDPPGRWWKGEHGRVGHRRRVDGRKEAAAGRGEMEREALHDSRARRARSARSKRSRFRTLPASYEKLEVVRALFVPELAAGTRPRPGGPVVVTGRDVLLGTERA